MRLFRRESAGGPAFGAPASRRRSAQRARRAALAFLALAAVGLEGCQSGFCGSCAGGGGKFAAVGTSFRRFGDGVRDTTARIFRHKSSGFAGSSGCCGGSSSGVEGMPVEGVVGGTVVGESIMGGGTVVPGSPPSVPANESEPKILEPLPPGMGLGTPGGAKSSAVTPSTLKGGGVTSGVGTRQTMSAPPSVGGSLGRGENLARATLLRDEPSGLDAGRKPSAALLDTLAPPQLPAEVARRGGGSPVPSESRVKAEGTLDRPVSPASATSNPVALPASEVSSADFPAINAGPDTSLAPGLRHFSSVKPGVSGGSLPDLDGLDWLKEKGIKTILDLRETTEVDPKFVDQISKLGFRYVSLPVVASRPEPAKSARFAEELARVESRPVYFFDADGSRAGLMWYVHRLTVDRVDSQLANTEARALGLTERATWVDATRYLDAAKANPSAIPTPTVGVPSASLGTPSGFASIARARGDWSEASFRPRIVPTSASREAGWR